MVLKVLSLLALVLDLELQLYPRRKMQTALILLNQSLMIVVLHQRTRSFSTLAISNSFWDHFKKKKKLILGQIEYIINHVLQIE